MVNASTLLMQGLPLNSSLNTPKPTLNFFDYNQHKIIDFIGREWKVIILTSVLTSTVIGIACYLYESFQWRVGSDKSPQKKANFTLISPSKLAKNQILKERTRHLEKMGPLIKEKMGDIVLNDFNQIKSVIEAGIILQFKVAHEHHELHDRIASLTDKIQRIFDRQLQDCWKSVLISLHHTPVACGNKIGDNDTLIFDASDHINRLEGKIAVPRIEDLDTSKLDDHIREQLYQIDFECFLDDLKVPWFENTTFPKHCLIARDPESGDILGALIYIEKDGYCIASLGRRAKAARLGIGRELLKKALEKIIRNGDALLPRIYLQVRKSNTLAIHCYTNLKFKVDQEIPNKYGTSHFPEGAIRMLYSPGSTTG